MIAPGVLLAATGVGASDLATAGFSGAKLGVTVAWAVLLGAMLKFVLTEGLTRWQLATGTTLLEGGCVHFGTPFRVIFLIYLLPWAFFTGGAIISASGTVMDAMLPLDTSNPATGRMVYGIAQSLLAMLLVFVGGFKLFERIMLATVGVMFLGVLTAAILTKPDLAALGRGLAFPSIPDIEGGLTWTVALLGGVGGTVTILCYGYWIREHSRDRPEDLKVCRIDLGVGYSVTAIFGIAVLVIASSLRSPAGDVVVFDGKGSGLLVSLADRMGDMLGPVGRWSFLIGAWATITSSLLGVWQAVPYLFADFVRSRGRAGASRSTQNLTRSGAYRGFLIGLSVIPIPLLFLSFANAQKYYAVLGACFIPLLAGLLLVMNGRRSWVGCHRNGVWSIIGLLSALVLFGRFAWLKVS